MPAMLVALGLLLVGIVAGFVDAIAGGGGLLTLPAILLTGLPPHMALGTNKGQGVFGTAMSLYRYANSPLLDRHRARQSFIPAFIGSALGVAAVYQVSPDFLAPLIMVLLGGVATYMIFQRTPQHVSPPVRRSFLLAAGIAFVIAFYDGFFGPGTGTFAILAYATLWGDRLDSASANAKVINFASNLAAMITFALAGSVVWKFALPMAAGQLIGGFLGAHATIRIGRSLVRYAVIAVSIALIFRLAWRML